MHALSARPLKVQGGRGFNMCADGTTVINLILLCSHPDAHLNLNREVCRSLTWHSSKSESALERFEPVAADKLRLDGSLAMFAPEGDGCLNRARREDAGRIHKAGTTLCDFWYFWSYKSTIKEKLLYVSIRRQQATALRTKSKYSQHTKRKIYTSFRRRTHLIHARPSFSSGRAETMRARICSASSCALFARVVWLRLRRAQNRRPSLCPLSHALATHGSRD